MKTSSDPPGSEITPEPLYVNRRRFLKAGALVATTVATGVAYRQLNAPSTTAVKTAEIAVVKASAGTGSGFRVDEPQTSLEAITRYNNFSLLSQS